MISHGLNKFLAAIFFAGVMIALIGFIGNKAIVAEELESDAVKVEVVEAVVKEATEETVSEVEIKADEASEAEITISDAEIEKRGKKLSKTCAGCHSFKKNGPHIMGPNLWNIAGAKIAGKEGFSYSEAMKNFGGVWDDESMDQLLEKPKDFIKGTKMRFPGMRKAEDRAIFIKWLNLQHDGTTE